jgi:uncharacterized UPF0160 family protein
MNEVLFNKDFNSRKIKCTGEIHSYFKRNYIHSLDEELSDNIKNMLKSVDNGDVKLALAILNHCNFDDKQTLENVKKIIEETECFLCFDVLDSKDEVTYVNFTSAKIHGTL